MFSKVFPTVAKLEDELISVKVCDVSHCLEIKT